MTRDYTFRDAGHLPFALRALNAAGLLAPGRPPLTPESLTAAARKQSGLTDFGDDSYREGLEVLCEALGREGDLHTFGRTVMRGLLVSNLATRLRVIDWAKRHPEVREERIVAPWVILGMPRTGTTLLSYLMDLDPRSRSLLQWESGALAPPPDLATHATDPRIQATVKGSEQLHRLIPPIRAMHDMGATLPTQCVTLFMLDFRSLQIETQALIPSYGHWLEKTDYRSAYVMHELCLQILQSRIPTGSWSLKTPQHLWSLPALRERYPDARLIWNHRDPAKVIPSVASLSTAFYRTFARNPDPALVCAQWNRKLHLAVSRGVAYDEQAGAEPWCCHVQFESLMDDPVGTVRGIYAHFGAELDPLHERRMEVWMRDRPQSAFGRHRYDLADFGITLEQLDEQYKDYRERFDVPRERRD